MCLGVLRTFVKLEPKSSTSSSSLLSFWIPFLNSPPLCFAGSLSFSDLSQSQRVSFTSLPAVCPAGLFPSPVAQSHSQARSSGASWRLYLGCRAWSRKIVSCGGSGRPNCPGLQAQLGFKDCLPALGAVSRPVFLSLLARLLVPSNLLHPFCRHTHSPGPDDLPPSSQRRPAAATFPAVKVITSSTHTALPLPGGFPPRPSSGHSAFPASLSPLALFCHSRCSGLRQLASLFTWLCFSVCARSAPCVLAPGSHRPHTFLPSLPHSAFSAGPSSLLWWPTLPASWASSAASLLLSALGLLLRCVAPKASVLSLRLLPRSAFRANSPKAVFFAAPANTL